MQVEPEEVGLWPSRFGRIKKFRGTSVLPPFLWENDPVLCQQHHVLSPLSWASSLQTITLRHQELTFNSHCCFSLAVLSLCVASVAFQNLHCLLCCAWPWVFRHKQPWAQHPDKDQDTGSAMGNLCITDEQPEIFLLYPCSQGADPALVHLSLTRWHQWRCLDQTVLSVWLGWEGWSGIFKNSSLSKV